MEKSCFNCCNMTKYNYKTGPECKLFTRSKSCFDEEGYLVEWEAKSQAIASYFDAKYEMEQYCELTDRNHHVEQFMKHVLEFIDDNISFEK